MTRRQAPEIAHVRFYFFDRERRSREPENWPDRVRPNRRRLEELEGDSVSEESSGGVRGERPRRITPPPDACNRGELRSLSLNELRDNLPVFEKDAAEDKRFPLFRLLRFLPAVTGCRGRSNPPHATSAMTST
mmetsp:Transcript_23837/g.66756  ORF Transcript_23837/g.66756 Transcript_23837/m.66756 type:complete len:133 (-) Transcript_23837:718-1116(-)